MLRYVVLYYVIPIYGNAENLVEERVVDVFQSTCIRLLYKRAKGDKRESQERRGRC